MRLKLCSAAMALSLLTSTSASADALAVERAGGLLAEGALADAAAAAQSCPDQSCSLILARALFGLHRLADAAAAARRLRTGPLAPYAFALEGEALLLSGNAQAALEPLRFAREAEGPPALRASALLADALLALGSGEEALREARRAASLAGQSPDTLAAMAWDASQALAIIARSDRSRAEDAAHALRDFWLRHPEHPAAESARAMQRELQVPLPEPSGRDLLLRASRLLSAGQPAAAAAQAAIARGMLRGADRAEAALLHARALAADGRRGEATSSLEEAWRHGKEHVGAQAGMLLARDRARHHRDRDAIQIADAVARRFPETPEAEETVLFTARLLADLGQRGKARARLAKLARRTSANASSARWTLAWMSYQDELHDTPERFAAFVASAQGDEERAQGLYWQARSGPESAAETLLRRAAELDSLGYYGLLARERLGQVGEGPVPFPPLRMTAVAGAPPRLALGLELASLGLLSEAAAEADWYVQHHGGDAAAAALPLYERVGRADRALLLAQALVGNRGARAPRALLDAAYPAAFPREVGASAERAQLDPYLVLAVMRRESLFKPDTRSAAGAVGLLQLLPATARRAAAVLDRPTPRDEQLIDPATAIDLGTWYLAELLGRFRDPTVALAAYNAGPRVTGPWAANGAGKPLDIWVEDLPYRETRRYVKVVLGAWSAYRILAGGLPPRLAESVPAPRTGANF